MIGAAILLQGLELVGWTGLWWKLKGESAQQILIHGRPQPLRIPVVDDKLKYLAGYPSKTERKFADGIVKVVRRVVNTRAFEHVVVGAVNRQSHFHKMLTKKPLTIRL